MTQEMVRPTDDPKGTTLQMRVSAACLKSIDDWRRKQADLPSRAESIRRLTTAMVQILDKDPDNKGAKPKKRKAG